MNTFTEWLLCGFLLGILLGICASPKLVDRIKIAGFTAFCCVRALARAERQRRVAYDREKELVMENRSLRSELKLLKQS